MCACIYNFLWILLSVCVSYYTRYDMIHDTIWYTINKNKKSIYNMIYVLTTTLVGIIVWEKIHLNIALIAIINWKKIKDLERKKERGLCGLVWRSTSIKKSLMTTSLLLSTMYYNVPFSLTVQELGSDLILVADIYSIFREEWQQ